MVKQVILISTTIKMSPGKVAAQACHAAVGAIEHTPYSLKSKWACEGQTTIILKASEAEILTVMEAAARDHIPFQLIRDAGRTEIEPGTLTALAIGPGEIDYLTNGLGLY